MFEPIFVLTCLTWVVIVLNVLDAITTYLALTKQGTAEGNPFMKFLMDKFGVVGALLISKVPIIGALVWLVLNEVLMPIWIIGPLAVFYVWVVFNNSKFIWGSKS